MGRFARRFAYGLVAWSAAEYAVHRWVMHRRGATDPVAREHRQHHGHPLDARPLALDIHNVSYKAAALVATSLIARPFMGPRASLQLGLGFAAGYAGYTAWHHRLHHGPPTTGIGLRLRDQHLAHHHEPAINLGVTSDLWDRAFATRVPQALTHS